MNRGRLVSFWSGVAIAAVGLGFGLFRAASAATSAASAAPGYVVVGCLNQSQVKPGAFSLACADDGAGLRAMGWTSWTPQLASGYGTEWANDCLPDCANGHVRDYPVVAVLWGSAAVPGHPAQRRYTEVTLIYKAARPAVYSLAGGRVVATHPVTQTHPLAP